MFAKPGREVLIAAITGADVVFPAGELKPYDTKLRDFKRGAFHLAAQARAPVMPLSIRFTRRPARGECCAANPP